MSARGRRILIVSVLILLAGLGTEFALGKKKDKIPAGSLEPQKRAAHVLNRLAYGPRPGEIDRVARMGVEKWIEEQLHPEKIDDSALEAKLAPFRTLRMDTRELVENFPPPQVIKQVSQGKAPLPHDPVKRAVYEAQLQKFDNKKEKKAEAGDDSNTTADGKSPEVAQEQRREAHHNANLKAEELLDLPPDERMKEILKLSPEEQHALAARMKGPKADTFMEGMSPQQKETLMALDSPERVVVGELMQAKLLRSIYSERQLDEVMTDFWLNHFNVYINKGPERFLLTSYERDTIRPHAMGKFEDLLVATAKSPAMLFYLDNWLSVGPESEVGLGIPAHRPNPYRRGGHAGPRPKANNKKGSGLNENYGRELMELHTLSVNGGYTQQDVTEVAKVFTGWTIEQPKKGGGFHFEPRMHEPGDKIVLGHKIKEDGENEGMEVLKMLARNAKTAHFISQKLAMRFVSDDPPATLVARMTQTFLKKDGDIREVLRTMFRSQEFWSPEAYRAKVKTPLEFVVSAVRASGAQVEDTRQLIGTLNTMGMMPYGMQPPTGYSMKADAWVNSSALLARMNFAMGLTGGKINGVILDSNQLAVGATDGQKALALLETSLLSGDVSRQTHETISGKLDDPQIAQRKLDDAPRPPNVAAIAGLILGSPEFQRR